MAKKETKTNKKENNKNKRSFWKDFKAELKKVVWPTPKQLVNNTVAVITIVFITAAIVFVLDLTFETLNKHGVDKIKEVVGTTNSTTEDTTNETIEDEENEETSNEENNEETSNEENAETSNEENQPTTENTETQNNAE